jgi:mRNA interferase YafQ
MEKQSYTVIQTSQFKKDLRRLKKSGQYEIKKIEEAIELLAYGAILPERYRHHYLTGDLEGYEECHLAFDWLLMFKRHHDLLILQLIRTGTHDQLF